MVVRSIALVSVLALAAPIMLEAREQRGYYGNQQAYNEGYQRGVRSGDEDGRRGESFSFSDESDFRRADAGYRREYGNVDWYRNEFRRGFEQGYRTGYDRYGYDRRNGRPGPPPWSNGRGNSPFERYGGNYRYNQYDLASQTGFNDGYERGLDDGRDRRRNDPFAESRYRDGDHGYDRRYGPRDAYKINYREAFRQGYERGYADGRATARGLIGSGRGGQSAFWPIRRPEEPERILVRARRTRSAAACRLRRAGGGAALVQGAPACDGRVGQQINHGRPALHVGTESLGRNLEHGAVAARDDRRGSRLAGHERHLAEVAARFRDRDLAPLGTNGHRHPAARDQEHRSGRCRPRAR